MKNLQKILTLFLISAIFVGCGNKKETTKKTQKKDEPLSIAEAVEQASFVTLQGDTIHVSDFKGKVVMIDFWETWCKPCIASFPGTNRLQKDFSKNFVAIAVTPGFSDTKKDAKAFAKSHDYDLIYAMDTYDLHKKLNVTAIPFKVFIDANGEFIKTERGSAGPKQDYKRIKKIIKKHS